MNFSHDKKHNVLVYDQQSPFVLQALPEAKTIGRDKIAVPFTLHNAQVLRHFNYPVPPIITDNNYDWPIEPGRKPLEHQKLMANFMVLHSRCFNLSDMGCVAGETLIETAYGKQRIDLLAIAGKPVPLRTLTNDGPRFVEVPAPFYKGCDALYRVTFKSGRHIIVTRRHVFLTCHGWVSCGNLALSERLPVFDVYPQQSSWEPCHVKSLPDAQRLTKIISSSSGYSNILVYDAPPLLVTDIAQSSPPSLDGVLRRSRFEWHTDAQGNKYTHMDPSAAGHHSTTRCGVQIDQGEMGAFLSEYATKLLGNQFHISARYRLFPSPLREVHEGQELRLCIPLVSASAPPFDTVTHIAYERTDAYYDMQVPEHENYVAHGLCHHNTMKTLSALWAADWLMQQHENFRCLISAPLSTLERVWANAIFSNFLSRRSFAILHHNDAERRISTLEKPADFYVVNFDGVGVGALTRKRFELAGFSKALSERTDIQLCICDEASAYKDAQTKVHRLARLIIGKRPYLLSAGTPTPNAPTDAYGLAKLVNNAFGKSFTTFRAETMFKVTQFKWVPMKDGYEKAKRLLTPSIRYDIKDIWDGPELTTQQRQVSLTPQQIKLMADLKRDLVVQLKSGQPISAPNEAAARQKFIQISLGAIYDEKHNVHLIDAKPRIEELKEIISQAPSKILCFAPLTSVIHLLYAELKKHWSCEIVNGETSTKDRSRIFEHFQRSAISDPRVLIADPGTMAHGLDLWQAQTVVWVGPTDKTELYLQANKRAHRPGQKFPVTVVQIVSNKLEQEIYKRLETNTSLQGVLLNMVRNNEL